MDGLSPPSFVDVLLAKKRISPYVHRTPLYRYPLLDQLLGAKVLVKHENHQITGAFKVRGGLNLISQLSKDERERGVITASTGNHGQSIAYASMIFGVKAKVCVPVNANPGKVSAIKLWGAEVIEHGRDFDEAKVYAEELAEKHDLHFISSGDEPHLIAGVATYTLEIIEDLPKVDVIIVPVGGGSGAAGACIVSKTFNPGIKVIGVQSEKAPAAYLTWKHRKPVESKMETFAEGLATRAPFMLPQSILWDKLDDFVLVSDEEILKGILLFLETTHNLAEGAAASTLAAAIKLKEKIKERKVVLVMSGGNLSVENLKKALLFKGKRVILNPD